ncbi:MAG TPA: hypothetical protein VH502_02505, partial [Actinoplanes sp.]
MGETASGGTATAADGERMATFRQYARRGLHRPRPWWQPMAFSAAAAAALSSLFNPLPAAAAPLAPA